jgi:hypothetical protein
VMLNSAAAASSPPSTAAASSPPSTFHEMELSPSSPRLPEPAAQDSAVSHPMFQHFTSALLSHRYSRFQPLLTFALRLQVHSRNLFFPSII